MFNNGGSNYHTWDTDRAHSIIKVMNSVVETPTTGEHLMAMERLQTCADLERIVIDNPEMKYTRPSEYFVPRPYGELPHGQDAGFYTMLAIADSTIRDAAAYIQTGPSILEPIEDAPIVATISSQEWRDASENLYPAIKARKTYENLLKLLGTAETREKQYIYYASRQQGFVDILTSTFDGKNKNETNELLRMWMIALKSEAGYYKVRSHGTTVKRPESMLGTFFNALPLEEILHSNPHLKERCEKFIEEACETDLTLRLQDMGKAILLLALITDQEDHPSLEHVVTKIRDLEDSETYILSISERMIAQEILHNQSGHNKVKLQEVKARSFEMIKLFCTGLSQEEVLKAMELEDSVSQRKNIARLMGQFSFGRAAGKQRIFRRQWIDQNGKDALSNAMIDLGDQLLYIPVPARNSLRGRRAYTILLHNKSFIRKFQEMPQADVRMMLKQIQEGKPSPEIATTMGVSTTIVRTFLSSLDRYLLDKEPVREIFTQTIKFKDEKVREAHEYINKMVALWRLDIVLPQSGLDVLTFSQRYQELKSQKYPAPKIAKIISEEMGFEYSRVSIMLHKSLVLYDLIKILEVTPEKHNSPILTAWALQKFVEHI